MNLENIINQLEVNYKILNMYQYGSQVYGCTNPNSDYDFMVIVEGDFPEAHIVIENAEITMYGEIQFHQMINEHEISALECLFVPEQFVVKAIKDFDFNLNLGKLRESLSCKSSNSWVKAKKKFSVEKDFNPYTARKSLFHSFRILNFGIQIAIHGKIINYQEVNLLLYEILDNPSEKWEDYKLKYQLSYNNLRSKFRDVCPK
jgi:hypothetical protein